MSHLSKRPQYTIVSYMLPIATILTVVVLGSAVGLTSQRPRTFPFIEMQPNRRVHSRFAWA